MNHGRNRQTTLILLAAAVIFIFYNPVKAVSQEADTISVPLYIDNAYQGEIAIMIMPDESVQIRPIELIVYLEELMTQEAVETAQMIFPETGWMNLTNLGGLGVHIIFSFEDLTLKINIPAHLRKETAISLRGRPKPPEGEYAEQSAFSAFLNLALWNKFTYESLAYEFSATPELGLNISGWVIEARGGINTVGDLLTWDYSRLVKDFPSIGYRLEAGDLTLPVTDLSGVSSLLGASFRKNYRLLEDTSATIPYERKIFLKEPAKIEIFLNDRKIREKDYQSGSYIIRDFPLTRGINNISIRWEDSEGPHEEIIAIPFESNLLARGDFDFGIAAGLPDRRIVLPAISSYQYFGLTDHFTFGLTESFSIETMSLSLSPYFLLSTNIGNFNLRPSWEMNFTGGQRIDTDLKYQFLKPGLAKNTNFGLNLSYNYDSIRFPDIPTSILSGSVYYNFYFGNGFSFTPDVSIGWRFDETRLTGAGKAALKKNIKGGSSLTANIGFSYDEEPAFSATISYSASFPDLNQNLYLLENLENQQLSAFWNRYPGENDSLSLNASTQIPIELEEKLSIGVDAGYNHPMFRLSGGHDFETVIANASMQNRTYLNAETGMVFADGIFMLSRPVNDSFIIIAPGDSFSDQIIRVNPSLSGSDLELQGKAGLMPEISSFKTHKIYIEPDELPEGMDDAGMKYLAYPSYKSAFVIKPQAEVRIYIGGFIESSEKSPIETVLGRLTGKNTGDSVDFFTDETGYFEAYGLRADTYSVQMAGYENSVDIDLSNIKSGFHDIGALTIPE